MSAISLKRSLPAEDADYTPSSSSKPAQKPRLSASASGPSTTSTLSIDRSALELLPQETLVSYVLGLQAAYKDLHAKTALKQTTLQPSSAANAAPATVAAEDPKAVAAMAGKLASMMASGIKTQMKWQPSCKTKGKRFAYDGMLPSAAVFHSLFNMVPEKKEWKQKKISAEAFQEITGTLHAPIRYGYLRITSADITIKWDRESNTFTVSGLYGL